MEFSRRDFLRSSALSLAALSLADAQTLYAAEGGASKGATKKVLPADYLILARTTFGARVSDYDAYTAMGDSDPKRIQHWVEKHLHPESIGDQEFEKRLSRYELSTLTKTADQLWKDHVIAADELKEATAKVDPQADPKGPKKRNENQLRLQPAEETEIATWLKAVYSERQLNEVLADFWHNHFNVFAWEGRTGPMFVNYDRDVIRAHMLGNFREMLEAVAKSQSMLVYLDNTLNQSGNPNENYARELFELHALGAENYLGTKERQKVSGFKQGKPIGYVDGDVYEAARAFTGWRFEQGKNTANTGHFEYFEQWHDRFQKVVLGQPCKEYQPPMKDGHDVLDRVANHPGTSRYIARKLCRRFVCDDPSQEFVEKIAKVFRDYSKEKDQLRRVVRALLLSDEFFSQGQPKAKRPFEYVAGVLRVSGAEFNPIEEFLKNYERIGQRLFGCRTPDGYPDAKEKWLGTSTLIERWRMVNFLCSDKRDQLYIPDLEKINGTAESILEGWIGRTFGNARDLPGKKQILDFLGPKPNENHVRMAVALVFNAPENQWR